MCNMKSFKCKGGGRGSGGKGGGKLYFETIYKTERFHWYLKS